MKYKWKWALIVLTGLFCLKAMATGTENLESAFTLDGSTTFFPGGLPSWSNPTGVNFITPRFDDVGETSSFVLGTASDYLPVSSWRWHAGAVSNPAHTLLNMRLAGRVVDNESMIFFAFDRRTQTVGLPANTAQFSLWLNQNDVTANNDLSPSKTFANGHSINDLLITFSVDINNRVRSVQVFKFVGSGGDAGPGGILQTLAAPFLGACSVVQPHNSVCAITNANPVSSDWPYNAPPANPSTPVNSVPVGAFFTGGINLSHFFLDVPCFRSALLASSAQLGANYNDFLVGSIAGMCSLGMTSSCSASVVDAGESGFVGSVGVSTVNTGLGNLYGALVSDFVNTLAMGDLPVGHSASALFNFSSSNNPPSFGIQGMAFRDPVNLGVFTLNGPDVVAVNLQAGVCPVVFRQPSFTLETDCGVAVSADGCSTSVNYNVNICNPLSADIGLTDVTVVDDAGTLDPSDDTTFVVGNLAKGECRTLTGHYVPVFPVGLNASLPITSAFATSATAFGTANLNFGNVTGTAGSYCTLCQGGLNVSVVTRAPTPGPTAAPTPAPTGAPTTQPTEAPTAAPSVDPSAEPSPAPSTEPTSPPSAEPTPAPSAEPSVPPTPAPTNETGPVLGGFAQSTSSEGSSSTNLATVGAIVAGCTVGVAILAAAAVKRWRDNRRNVADADRKPDPAGLSVELPPPSVSVVTAHHGDGNGEVSREDSGSLPPRPRTPHSIHRGSLRDVCDAYKTGELADGVDLNSVNVE